MYFAGGIAVTAAAAVAVSKNARLMHLMTRNSLLVSQIYSCVKVYTD